MGKKAAHIYFLTLLVLAPLRGDDPGSVFPVSEKMKLQVQFWVNVFTKYSIYQKVVHDAVNPLCVYSVIDFRDYIRKGNLSKKERNNIARRERQRVAAILNKLAYQSYTNEDLSPEEQRIHRLFGKNPSKKTFAQAARRIHLQGGMKEAFLNGLNRSGR